MIYFIQSGLSGPIKIGYTSICAEHRLKALQTGSWEELKLLGTIDGNADNEHELHQRFMDYFIRGEWYWPAQSLIIYINNLLNIPSMPKIAVTLSTAKLPEYEIHKKNYILQILSKTRNNKMAAAKILKISRSTLYAKLERY